MYNDDYIFFSFHFRYKNDNGYINALYNPNIKI